MNISSIIHVCNIHIHPNTNITLAIILNYNLIVLSTLGVHTYTLYVKFIILPCYCCHSIASTTEFVITLPVPTTTTTTGMDIHTHIWHSYVCVYQGLLLWLSYCCMHYVFSLVCIFLWSLFSQTYIASRHMSSLNVIFYF